ncbi:HU family DNA-binding protein [Paraliomyxa miuraensis]|uniref:HU family DNA-binding protein n=1 Tax=Paraliomyxa miuraensis TaxID=376150 RepID=UPI002253156B|nr:HU family DNA-binding protein [Paraliomyxa miuraensis]MCX4244651.1 HU family DNA-binding protein [Paraliomyxa miuraensis]
MTKAELIERIARSRDLPPDTSKKLIGQILGIAFDELASYFARARVTRSQSPRFTFPRFGTFTKKRRSARRGVNPRTLEPIQIEACNTIDFKASRELRDAMNPTLRVGDGAELSGEPPDGGPATGWPDVESSERVAASVNVGPNKKKAKARAKVKARARDAASARTLAVGPSKRRLTPRDDEPGPDALDVATGHGGRSEPEPELAPSPMQRVSSRRRTRSRGTG